MIIDVHSHSWEYPRDFSDDFRRQAKRAQGRRRSRSDRAVRGLSRRRRRRTCGPIVFGGKAKLSAACGSMTGTSRTTSRTIRTRSSASCRSIRRSRAGRTRCTRATTNSDFAASSCCRCTPASVPTTSGSIPSGGTPRSNNLPVLLHTGTTFVAQAPLDCTLPRLLDRVAIRFPDVKIILAHLGHPYEGECVVTIRKHPNVYADISALHYRPFQLYHSLMLVQEYGVWDKVLFGTDYPFTTVNATIDGLRKLERDARRHGPAATDETKIEAMIARDLSRSWACRSERRKNSRPSPTQILQGHVGDRLADRDRSGGGRRGRVQHVDHALGLADEEVVHEFAVRARPPAPARRRRPGRGRGTTVRGSAAAARARTPPATASGTSRRARSTRTAAPSARSRGSSRSSSMSRALTSVSAVALAPEREHRVRAALDAAADHPREVDAEERQARVGHRVDEVLAEVFGVRLQFVILAAERDDLHARDRRRRAARRGPIAARRS